MSKKIFYKGFDKDLKCRGFQFQIGKTYEVEGKLEICNNGFHFCDNLKDVLEYYSIIGNNNLNRYCEIEVLGEIEKKDNKFCSNKIKIVKELSREEIIVILGFKNNNLGFDNTGDSNTGNWNTGDKNTGNWNTGYRNTGNWNTGYRNTGNWNTGDSNTGDKNTGDKNTGDKNTGNWNTGDSNTGNWNSCNLETGFFNSINDKYCRVFNKKCLREKWENSDKPNFIFNVYPNIWISLDSMSFEEIKEKEKTIPQLKNQGGYLKNISMQEAWKVAFINVSERDIELLKKLPNYSYKVFSEITGIEDERLN